MPVAPHIVRTAAALAITEATRPELVEFGGKNLRAENVRQFHQGEAATRSGFVALGNTHVDASTPTAGYKLLSDARSPVRICDGQIEAYSSKLNAWQTLGRVPECGARLIDVPSVGQTTYFEDMDATNGYLALSWLSINASATADAFLSIVDQATGAVVRVAEKVGTSVDLAPALLAVQGNYFITVRSNSTGTKLQAWYLDTTSAATINAGWVAFAADLCTDVNVGFVLHSLPSVSTPRVAVLYLNTSGGASRLTLLTITTAGVAETLTINTSSVTPGAFALGGNSTDTLWATWSQNTVALVMGLSPFAITTTPLAAPASILTFSTGCNYLGIAPSSTLGKARVWGNDSNTTTYRSRMCGVQTTSGNAASDGTQVTVPNVGMVRKPFFYNGRYYSAFFTFDDRTSATSQHNFIVCDWTDNVTFLRPVANPAPGLASPGLTGQGKFVAGTTATTYYAGMGVARSGVTTGSALLELDFASTQRWQYASWGNSTYLSGGLASYYDGQRVAEIGFLIRPTLPTMTTSAGSLTATTGYRYVCVYEEVDADGNWHQSGLSNPSASTGALASKTVTVVTTPLTISSRLSSALLSPASARTVRVAIYRTLDGGVAPYYRVGTILNDTSSTTVSYVDTTTDAVLAANAKLYAQPGVLNTNQDKRPPPFFSCIVNFNGMLIGASGSDVWYSGQNVSGEGVWFNPLFQVPVPGDGDITGMWATDGTLFVAKRRDIYAMAGEAPADNGTSGGLGLPRRLAVDIGCIESRSVCSTSLGTFFQSDRGIELFTRAQAVQWIGQPVQDTLASFPVMTAVTLDPASPGTIYFELAAAQSGGLVTGTGRTLVFDLAVNDWVSMDRRASASGAVDAPAQSACMINTGTNWRYAWIASNGYVHYEEPTTHLDANGSFVVPLIETGWFNAFPNEQRVWRASVLFQRYTNAGLLIEVAYDYGDYDALDNAVWSETDTAGQRQLEWSPQPRGESVKFRISATAPAVLGTGQGLGIFGLALDLMSKQGPTKGTLRLDPALRR